MSMRSFSFPAQGQSAPEHLHATPSLLPPVKISSPKSACPRGMSKIVRKVASMSLGADREGTQATGSVTHPSPVSTSPRRSSALIRLDASIAKLRAHRQPRGLQPPNPSLQLHHTKSQSFGCMKLGKICNGEIASGGFYKTPAESSTQCLGPTRMHHLKSRSLACLTKTGRHSKLEPVNEHHMYESRPSPRHLPPSQAQQNMPRSRSFGSLKPHRSPMHMRDGLGQPDHHGHNPSQSEKWIKRSTRVYAPTAEYQHVKSFIDVTPEQRKRSSSGLRLHKERIKKFLARASGGVMGWGKFLARKA